MAKGTFTHSLYICLSDIPKHVIRTGKNNKKYVALRLVQLDEVSQYDNDGIVAIDIKKEDQQNGEKYIVGNSRSAELIHKLYEQKKQYEQGGNANQDQGKTENVPF